MLWKMPIVDEIVELLCTLAEEERLRVTLSQTLRGSLTTGLSAGIAALFMGPYGFVVGGTLGGLIAAARSQKFLPVVQVIATMNPEQRETLSCNVQKIMAGVDVNDVAVFAAMIAGDISVRRRVLETLVDYLKHEMAMSIVG